MPVLVNTGGCFQTSQIKMGIKFNFLLIFWGYRNPRSKKPVFSQLLSPRSTLSNKFTPLLSCQIKRRQWRRWVVRVPLRVWINFFLWQQRWFRSFLPNGPASYCCPDAATLQGICAEAAVCWAVLKSNHSNDPGLKISSFTSKKPTKKLISFQRHSHS